MGATDQTICSSRHAWGQTSKMIAIIDDEEAIQNSLRDLVEPSGLFARCFGFTEEFLESEWHGKAPCLIVDASKPKMLGLQLQKFATAEDIAQRKRAEDALQRTQFYLNEGQRLAHMGSWAFNAAGFDYWSSELFRIHGLQPSSKPPTVEEYLDLVHPEDRQFMKEGIQRMLADHRGFDFTKRIVRPDGNIRYVRCVGVLVIEGVTFKGFVGTGIDVTEQELIEQERERSRQLETELAHTNRVSMLGEMAASLAHEIKQPIAAAVANAGACLGFLAGERPDISEARDAASGTLGCARRAAEIIDHVRSLFKKSFPQREPVNLNELIREIALLLRND